MGVVLFHNDNDSIDINCLATGLNPDDIVTIERVTTYADLLARVGDHTVDSIVVSSSCIDLDNGFALQYLRQRCPEAAIVIASPNPEVREAIKAIHQGADDYFNIEELPAQLPALIQKANFHAAAAETNEAEAPVSLYRSIDRWSQPKSSGPSQVQRTRLDTMASLLRQVLLDIDTKTLFDQAIALLKQSFDVDYCGVFEFVSYQRGFVLRAASGWPKAAVDQVTADIDVDSAVGYALLSGRPVLIENLPQAPELVDERLYPTPVQSLLNMLISGASQQPLGYISLASHQCDQFTQDDASFLQAVANTIAMAMERKQSEQSIRSHIQELACMTTVLANTNDELAERNRELNEFVYITSHDLKAPLRAIANLSEWIEEDLQGRVEPEISHYMWLLRKRVFRIESLLNGLLQYSRVGQLRIDAETVSVATILKEVVDLLDPPATFTIIIGDEMPVLKTRRLPLQHTFSSLIGNAIKHHTSPQGRVEITAKRLDQQYEFTVADNGPGIAPEHHEKIFTIFQVLEPRDKTENTGVGLAIARKIVEAEGGKISVASALGCGATFKFTWPVE